MAQTAFDITRLDAHNHDGVNSAFLSAGNFVASSIVALHASWAVSGALYKQTLTTPVAVTEINNSSVSFLINNAGPTQYQKLYLQYQRKTATTFDLYINDNTIDVLCLFK